MKIKYLKLGCDPELFLQDQNGFLRSVVGKIGGTKSQPLPLLELGDGFCVQEDNVAMEFNIPAASSAKEFVESISKAVRFLDKGMQTRYGLKVCDLSAAHFDDEELADPRARMFGCDPDYNAWTASKNPRPNAKDPNLRSAGGHIHVGYLGPKYDVEKENLGMFHARREGARSIIKSMDLFLGVPSVLMDKGELRKELYGKAGAFRLKEYGVEYRTLSNFWVLKENLTEWAWRNTERAVEYALENYRRPEEADFTLPFEIEDRPLILDAIDNNNKEVAQTLVEKYKLDVVNV